jgi:hypothetical protein
MIPVPVGTSRQNLNRFSQTSPPISPLLFGTSVVLAFVSFGFMLFAVTRSYPIYCREAHEVFSTSLLLQGKNPYSIEHHPALMHCYGIVHALIAWPPSILFGHSVQFQRLISCAAILGSTSLLYWVLRVGETPRHLAISGALLLLTQLTFSTAISAKPDGLGLFLLLASLVVPVVADFRLTSLAFSAAFIVIAYFTKPYFIIGAPLVAGYLFCFRSKVLGLAFGLAFFVLLITGVLVVNAVCPLYFTDTFFFYLGSGSINRTFGHLVEVLLKYGTAEIGLVAVLAWVLVIRWRFLWGETAKFAWKISDLREPLILRPSIPFVTFALLFNSIVYLCLMGPHTGNGRDYLVQIVVPFLIWQVFELLARPEHRSVIPISFLLLEIVSVVVLCVGPVAVRIIPHFHDQEAAWGQIRRAIAVHHEVFGTYVVGPELWNQRKTVYDNGATEFYACAVTNNPLPIAKQFAARCQELVDNIDFKIRHQKFDAIVLRNDEPSLFQPDLLHRFYRKTASIPYWLPFPCSRDEYISVWEPKSLAEINLD